MAKNNLIHTKASSSWWNDTVTALCGATFHKSQVERVWFSSPTCPGVQEAQGRQVMAAVTETRPRVWLVAGLSTADSQVAPADGPVVRDDLMRRWYPGVDGRWHTADGRHHVTWADLRSRYDLVEVTS